MAFPSSTTTTLARASALLALCGCADVLGDVDFQELPSITGSPLRGDAAPNGEIASSGVAGTGVPGDVPTGLPGNNFSSDVATQPQLIAAPAQCGENDLRCLGAVRQSCAPDGSHWLALEGCASDSLCTPERCLQPSCATHELRCDGSELQECSEGRDGWLLIAACASPAHCSADSSQCAAEACRAGTRRCNGGRLEHCSQDRSNWELVVACESRELCDATLAQGSDRCAPPACDARQLRCHGSNLEMCNASRSDWERVDQCATAQLCEASQQTGQPRCAPARCAAGESVCVGNQLQSCEAGLGGFVAQQSCLDAELCDPVRGRCSTRDCSPGEQRCNGAQIESCDAALTGFVPTDEAACATPQLCRAAQGGSVSCGTPVCAEGEFRCAGNLLQRCSGGRDAWLDFETCASANLCDAAFGPRGCRPAACQPGQRRCLGDELRQCRAGGEGSDQVADCTLAGGCDPVALDCRDPCVVGSVRCSAERLERCDGPLLGWQGIECASAELCNAAQNRCDPPVCDAGARRCSGANLEECGPARTGFVGVEQCGSAALCVQSDPTTAACTPPACAANETRCNGNDTLLTCNADRTGFVSERCDGLLNSCVAGPPAACRR